MLCEGMAGMCGSSHSVHRQMKPGQEHMPPATSIKEDVVNIPSSKAVGRGYLECEGFLAEGNELDLKHSTMNFTDPREARVFCDKAGPRCAAFSWQNSATTVFTLKIDSSVPTRTCADVDVDPEGRSCWPKWSEDENNFDSSFCAVVFCAHCPPSTVVTAHAAERTTTPNCTICVGQNYPLSWSHSVRGRYIHSTQAHTLCTTLNTIHV